MNRRNVGNSKKVVPTRNPGDPVKWSRIDKDAYAGGLIRAGYERDAGYDLAASRQVTVPANGFGKIPTNMNIGAPDGCWGMIVGRSSTFFKRQLLVQTAIIDGGFTGEIWCVVRNMSDRPVTIRRGERVIQYILFSLITPETIEVDCLPAGDRGNLGFGSTGIELSADATID